MGGEIIKSLGFSYHLLPAVAVYILAFLSNINLRDFLI